MYQVIKMFGDWEPWWFIDGWQDDIVLEKIFENWEEALAYYQKEWSLMKSNFENFHSQKNLLATFWKNGETRWCEECVDDLQQFHSILLLKDYDIIAPEDNIEAFEQANNSPTPPYLCKLNL